MAFKFVPGCCCEEESSSSSSSSASLSSSSIPLILCGCDDANTTVKMTAEVLFPYDSVTIAGNLYAGLAQFTGTYEYVFKRFGANNGVDCTFVADLAVTSTAIGTFTKNGIPKTGFIVRRTTSLTLGGIPHKSCTFVFILDGESGGGINTGGQSFFHKLCGYPSGDLFGRNPTLGGALQFYETTATQTITRDTTEYGFVMVARQTTTIEAVLI